MKYLKTFEKQKEREITLYKNKDFNITINNSNGNMTYGTNYRSCSPIYGIIEQIIEKSECLNDPELRKIIITEKERESAMQSMNPKYSVNRIKYHTSPINGFIGGPSKIEIRKMPDNVYTELTEIYSPIIENIIKKSKTMGDIIDEFKILYDVITENLPLHLASSNFNL